MDITLITYFTREGAHLDPVSAPQLLDDASHIVSTLAPRLGWRNVGRDRAPGNYQEATYRGIEHRHGIITSRVFALDDGAGHAFTLDLIENTGIMPVAGIVTARSLDRLRTHAALIHVLHRLNIKVFKDKLIIKDSAGYYPTFDPFALADAFHADADDALALIRQLEELGLNEPDREQPIS